MSAYGAHVREVEAACARALEVAREGGEGFDSIVFHAGSPGVYHADDLEVPFRANAHFLRFGWVEGAGHLIVLRPGEPTRLIRSVASDFWHGPPARLDPEIAARFEVSEAEDAAAAARALEGLGRAAFVGSDPTVARAAGIEEAACNPAPLIAALDWERAFKTDYEIDCIREANRIAARGHEVVRDASRGGSSEFAMHLDYLAATAQTDDALPYPNIIAWDEAAAVLHYPHRRQAAPEPGRVLLIDAGARHRGYASDVTRTWLVDPSASETFRALLEGMEELQRGLAADVAPGVDFVELHRRAESGVARLLRESGVLLVDEEEARAGGLVFAFFPHGLGHPLGLQTHDVGGHQADARGNQTPPPEDCPHLRHTRRLAPRHVVTIEPGLYFIPALLEPLRGDDAIDWRLVDTLLPCGGIRIEDDVLVGENGSENLTRRFLP